MKQDLKHTELRCGNLVYNSYLKEVRAVDYLDIRDHAEQILYTPFHPIPLTPEWLTRFGFFRGGFFKKHSESFYEIGVGSSSLFINPDNGVVWIERNDNVFNNPALIKYVHQLQNLFFSLTGSELTLDSKTVTP